MRLSSAALIYLVAQPGLCRKEAQAGSLITGTNWAITSPAISSGADAGRIRPATGATVGSSGQWLSSAGRAANESEAPPRSTGAAELEKCDVHSTTPLSRGTRSNFFLRSLQLFEPCLCPLS